MNSEIKSSLASIMPAPERTQRKTSSVGTEVSKNGTPQTQAGSRAGTPTAPRAEDTQRQETPREAARKAEPERNEVEDAARELGRRADKMGRDLRFEVDDDSGMTVVKVIDRLTDEVVRQIPSEEAVARASNSEDDSLSLIEARA